MARFVFIAGARPNFMKVAPILRALSSRPQHSAFALVHTGQHYDPSMSGVFFEQLGIAPPDAKLDVGSGSHGAQTGRIMSALDEWFEAQVVPTRAVVVVGDVNSTMAGALVAAKRQLPVVHVEAGLRCFDRTMPEEINRVVTDAISDVLLVSEPSGLENLSREGIPASRVHYVGNVMIDTLLQQLDAARALDVGARWGLAPGTYAVLTLHRAANVDDAKRLASLVATIERVATRLPIVFPVHPRTRARLGRIPAVHVCEPLGYREFISLVGGARVVITDSGGIQEETTYLGIPCVTLRETTERPITVTSGTNVLVGNDSARIDEAVASIVAGHVKKAEAIRGWDGHAADRIVDVLMTIESG